MKRYFILLSLSVLFGCSTKFDSSLELNFTSQNRESFNFIKSFYLTANDGLYPEEVKRQIFQNIKCESPNRFILKNIKPGLYFGLMQIENKSGQVFNIFFDSISINHGNNHLTKELNLGSVSL